ncbi:PREDICTED: C-type lectin 37Db-like, partial [Bactrocera latifrons]|uniref:C-type lectin 37Db-like n=1 Tax=Bactrocera latifrons TaxID=174628 RepID=UPI0008DCAF65
MGLTQYFILIWCFARVLPQSINISNRGESEKQPFIQIGSKYYLINTATTMNWFGAMLYCRNYDSDLAVIESAAEMNALSSYLLMYKGHTGTNFWLGVTDLAEEGKFMSIKDGRPMRYAKWAGSQPDNSGQNEDCVHLWLVTNIFHINDGNCMAQHYAICELRQPKKKCDVCDLKNFIERYMQDTNIPHCQN